MISKSIERRGIGIASEIVIEKCDGEESERAAKRESEIRHESGREAAVKL